MYGVEALSPESNVGSTQNPHGELVFHIPADTNHASVPLVEHFNLKRSSNPKDVWILDLQNHGLEFNATNYQGLNLDLDDDVVILEHDLPKLRIKFHDVYKIHQDGVLIKDYLGYWKDGLDYKFTEMPKAERRSNLQASCVIEMASIQQINSSAEIKIEGSD